MRPCRWSGLAWLCAAALSAAAHAAMPAPPDGPKGSDSRRLERSHARWLQIRQVWADNYRYEVRWQSAFGFGHTTGVEVRQGRVVRRDFQAWRREPGADQPEVLEQWTQTEPQSASAADQRAAAALTLDQLYAMCREQLQRKRPEGQRQVLEFDALGLLRACYRFNPGIADDTPQAGVPFIELAPLR